MIFKDYRFSTADRWNWAIFNLLPVCFCLLIGWNSFASGQTEPKSPDFNREVRPILAAKCYTCHGPDEESREADLRLDDRESALEIEAIVPGKASESELFHRIQAKDDSLMPPKDSGLSLSEQEKSILERWIDSGAPYQEHWAFVPPVKPETPPLDSLDQELQDWIRNPIDRFVLKRLVLKNKRPSASADRMTLVRRVYLDLIGLPPTPAQADAFVQDPDPAAYEKLVDKLLKSKSYGEKWAREWLDLARYADTNGYEKDRPRSIWPYRDWVIRSINEDMPFDQFTIEQLAGDMLDNATNSQQVATGFHRNTMLNEEGGIDPLEYRFHAMVDRVATTGTVWMGLSVGCAQCHTHKYDPITHTDFYRVMALLNNADEPDLNVSDPVVQARAESIRTKIKAAKAKLKDQFVKSIRQQSKVPNLSDNEILRREVEAWIDQQKLQTTKWELVRPDKLKTNLPKLEVLDDLSIFASGDFTKRDVYQLEFQLAEQVELGALRLEVLPDQRLPSGGPGNAYYEGRKGDFFLSELKATLDGTAIDFDQASTTFGKISIGSGSADGKNVFDNEGSTGWSASGQEGKRNVLVLNFAKQQTGRKLKVELTFERHFVASLGRFRLAWSSNKDAKANGLPDPVERAIAQHRSGQDIDQSLLEQFLLSTNRLQQQQQAIRALEKQLPKSPETMVFRERAPGNPRVTYRHHRGEYLSSREVVEPELPSLFKPFKTGTTANRLSFARWLVSEENPLAARVTVNRYWQSFFGRGLVDSAGDFGTQSNPPSHPQLLDWLAVSFRENGWSRKKLHRLIVTSATYRQNSQAGADSFQWDPENQWLSRGPRFRVNAEVVRDIILSSSGKLSGKMYGPSVYPPQPASVTAIAYGNTRWPVSKGEDRYRRSLYTFSKRTAPFAAYLTFNSPTGENCLARRNRSNTPLQALTILNDEMFVELARALSHAAIKDQDQTPEKTATYIFRRLLTRKPKDQELNRIVHFYQRQLSRLESGELSSEKITSSAPPSDKQVTNKLAAWVLVARALMSLDEVITKQ